MEGLRRIYTTFGYKVLDVHRKRGRDEWGELPIGRWVEGGGRDMKIG